MSVDCRTRLEHKNKRQRWRSVSVKIKNYCDLSSLLITVASDIVEFYHFQLVKKYHYLSANYKLVLDLFLLWFESLTYFCLTISSFHLGFHLCGKFGRLYSEDRRDTHRHMIYIYFFINVNLLINLCEF